MRNHLCFRTSSRTTAFSTRSRSAALPANGSQPSASFRKARNVCCRPFAEADCEQFSEAAIRAGYAGVAEWLVRTGRWESISSDQEDAIRSRLLPAKATEVGPSPCASVERQDIGGHDLHGM